MGSEYFGEREGLVIDPISNVALFSIYGCLIRAGGRKYSLDGIKIKNIFRLFLQLEIKITTSVKEVKIVKDIK